MERKGDIPQFCEHFIKSINEEAGTHFKGIEKRAMDVLMNWKWPGNVRELKNVIERGASVSEDGAIKLVDLPDYLTNDTRDGNTRYNTASYNASLKKSRNQFEKQALESALDRTGWNKSRAAKRLGISRPLLYALIKKYGLSKPGTTKVPAAFPLQ